MHLLVQPLLPSERLRQRVRCRSRKRGNRQQSDADDTGGVEEKTSAPRQRLQRLRCLPGCFDAGDPEPVKRQSRGDDDEEHHQIGDERTHADVQPSSVELEGRCASTRNRGQSSDAFFFFYFLRGLPEKQIRTDGGAEDGDDGQQIISPE